MIKAVVFDMDGVLIDAKEWHYEALNEALDQFNYTITRKEHIETFDGLPTQQKLNLLTLEKGLPESIHSEIKTLKQELTIKYIHEKCTPNLQIIKTLRWLKRHNYLLAVASNSIEETVSLMMEKSAFAEYLDLQLSSTHVRRPKPDPEIYLTAIQHLNLKPHEVLVVEDSEYGLQAARAAGTHILQVNSTKDVNLANILSKIGKIAMNDDSDI